MNHTNEKTARDEERVQNLMQRLGMASAPSIARSTDPLESHEAAARVNVKGLVKRILWALEDGPLTSSEIAAKLDTERDSVSPRRARMVRAGLIKVGGRREGGSETLWRKLI